MEHYVAFSVKPFNPFTKAMLKLAVVILVGGSCINALIWMAGVASSGLLAVQLFLLAACATIAAVFSLKDRGKRVLVTPTELVIERGSVRNRYPWPDVRAVRLEAWTDLSAPNRLFANLLYGSEASTPYVHISLRRAIRFPLWGPGPGTRVRGIIVPGINAVNLYLDEPEAFVKHAQGFLEPSPPSR